MRCETPHLNGDKHSIAHEYTGHRRSDYTHIKGHISVTLAHVEVTAVVGDDPDQGQANDSVSSKFNTLSESARRI